MKGTVVVWGSPGLLVLCYVLTARARVHTYTHTDPLPSHLCTHKLFIRASCILSLRGSHSAFTPQTTGIEGFRGPVLRGCPGACASAPPCAGRDRPGSPRAQRGAFWKPQPRQRHPLCSRPHRVPSAHKAS